MNQELITQVKELMAPVAEKIGQGAEFGWEVVMRQQYVVAAGNFIAFLVLISLFVYLFIKSREGVARDEDYVVFTAAGSMMCLVFASLCFYDGLAHIINPQYYALEFFVNLVK